MCDHCHHLRESSRETRRSFLQKLVAGAAIAGLMRGTRVLAQEAPPPITNPGWARLITPNRDWNFHEEQDRLLTSFVRRSDLKFDGEFNYVDPANLEKLCAYPFIFTADMRPIRDQQHWANIREYFYRGGFVFIDNCLHISPNTKEFAEDHVALLTRLLPGSEVRRISAQHPIFHAHFPLEQGQLARDPYDPTGKNAMFGIFDDDRMVALLSMAHLLCVWHKPTQHPDDLSNSMIANIYAYSRAH
jgi:Domain of unknown function (DUF4159)